MRRLAAAAVAAALLAAPSARATPPAVTATASFAPLVHAFADPVTATVTVAVDPRRVVPGSVRVVPSFAPYVAEPARVASSSSGGLLVLRYAFRIGCRTVACDPGGRERTIALRPVLVGWRSRAGAAQTLHVPWPPLLVASRLTQADLARPALLERLEPPPPQYAVSPTLLGDGLLALGCALALAGLATVVRLLLARRRPRAVEPLRRALELVESAAAGDVLERRRALYQLALVLEQARLEPESWAARKLAWAPSSPDPEGMQLLSLVIRGQLREAS